ITALSNITQIVTSGTGEYGRLQVSENESLASLEGLDNVTQVGYHLRITDLPALINLAALNSVQQVSWLQIANNDLLINMQGLNNLTMVGQLDISNNSALLNLEGLESLTDAFGDVSINGNESLTSLQGLNN